MAETNYPPIKMRGPVGKPIVRKSGREKVSGKATFTAEWPIDGLLHAVPVPSTIARGKVVSIDASEAKQMPGVRFILTPDNVPDFERVASGSETGFETSIASSIYPAAEKEVFYAGQYIAAVVADTFETARDAAMQVKVKYETTDHVTDIDQAPADERPGDVFGEPPVITINDAEAALHAAEVVIDEEYPTHMNHHNPMEPHAAIAHFTEKDEKPFLTVYETSQSISVAQTSYAKVMQLNAQQVRVICKYIGGAFGSKGLTWPHALLACFCAKVANAPVKVVVSRSQMYGGTGHRTPMRQRVAIGCSKEGHITSLIHEGTATVSRKENYVEAFTLPTRMMYDTQTLRLAQRQCRLDTQLPTFMRAPPETPGMFVLESAMDEMATKLGIDPLEFRIRNEPQKDIHKNKPFSGRYLVECLRQGAKEFSWHKRIAEPRSQREGSWLIGYGVASSTFPVNGFPTQARITVRDDGTAEVACCSHELGTGTATVQSQLLADLLDIPAGRVSMVLGDTQLPPGGISGGSSTTHSLGSAVSDAVEQLKKKLIDSAPKNSFLEGKSPKDIQFQDGHIIHGQDKLRLEDFLAEINRASIVVVGKFDGGEDSPTSNHSYGAQFVEVAVDEDFGIVRLRRMLACFACGTLLNAKTARSQFMGGMIMGVGHALQEATHWDHRLGRITNDNLSEYHIPVNADIPAVDIMWIDEPDFNASPIGAKGIGEIGITGVSAAIANAIYNATGRRCRELPITLEKVMA
ncbi:xanthine dehydrogenase family protein molybdopterin-binding subunit [Bremerella alba]|uniref:Putative xanthine dehydrogenase YagR molybdenum-binding subunit n=1 Tax=Bremerella alba TaxID=980252 RepID=A0A7V8V284_9BACT|nr:xanthine dehydrogenase family protein molybdopterin-binding subunit [Bremerella alba]MBA2113593.1 putative xanthine dehydrogenase YagR molybdenum-binding subunit [Bremerella alba]